MYFVKVGYNYINMERITLARLTPNGGVYVYDGANSGYHLEGDEAAQMRALLGDLAVPDDAEAESTPTDAGRAQSRQYEDGPQFDVAAERVEAADDTAPCTCGHAREVHMKYPRVSNSCMSCRCRKFTPVPDLDKAIAEMRAVAEQQQREAARVAPKCLHPIVKVVPGGGAFCGDCHEALYPAWLTAAESDARIKARQ